MGITYIIIHILKYRGVSSIFSSGADSIFFWRGAKMFLLGAKKVLLLLKISAPGRNTQEVWADYLIIAKERIVLASSPNERTFHQGQKHTISNFIRGIFG